MTLPTHRSAKAFVENFLQHSQYDPVKAHAYYEQHKHLKGRRHGSGQGASVVPINRKASGKTTGTPTTQTSHSVPPALEAQIQHIEARLGQLRAHLQKLLDAKRKSASKSTTPKKETPAEKAKRAAANKKYQHQHKAQLATKRKAAAASGGSGGGSATPISSMTETQLRAAISRCEANLHEAVAKARAAVNGGTA